MPFPRQRGPGVYRAVSGISELILDRERQEIEELSRSPQPFRRGELVRVVCELDGLATGSEGIATDWYAGEPDRVVVYLWAAHTRIIPAQALEHAA
jgi:uncharacterized Fe-S cluster-containing radical SAM superfamily enzyme